MEVAKTRKRIHVTLIGGGTLLFSIGGALFQYSIEADGGPQNPMPDWTLPLLAGAIGAMLGLIAAQDFSDRAEDRIVNMMLKKLKKITTEAQAALSKTILED